MSEARLTVHVQPSASSGEVGVFADGVLRARVTAPPQKGKANEALVTLLARTLGVRRAQISIVRGFASRQKVVAVAGMTMQQVEAKLRGAAPVLPDSP